jgi:phosphate transport system permease protein
MTTIAFALLLAAAILGYLINQSAAKAIRSNGATLHSLVGYHAGYSALLVILPGLLFLLFWIALQGVVINRLTMASLPSGVLDGMEPGAIQLVLSEIISVSRGTIFGTPKEWQIEAAAHMNDLRAASSWLMIAGLAALIALGLFVARRRVAAEFRARQAVEKIIHGLMVGCSMIAIVTTIGIVLSLVFESYQFFRLVPITEFLFGTNWEPSALSRLRQTPPGSPGRHSHRGLRLLRHPDGCALPALQRGRDWGVDFAQYGTGRGKCDGDHAGSFHLVLCR